MKANVMGYSLNQKGLFGGVVRDPRDRRVKLNTGTGFLSMLHSRLVAEILSTRHPGSVRD